MQIDGLKHAAVVDEVQSRWGGVGSVVRWCKFELVFWTRELERGTIFFQTVKAVN